MGVMSISSSAARTLFGLSTRFPTHISALKRPLILPFETDKTKNTAFVLPHESVASLLETSKEKKKRRERAIKPSERIQAVSADISPSIVELDYNEAAAKLENIYKLSPATDVSETEDRHQVLKRGWRKRFDESEENAENGTARCLVRSRRKKAKRLSLDKRIALRKANEGEVVSPTPKIECSEDDEDEKISQLFKEYSVSMDLVGLHWKKMKIPSVLSSSEHAWLFKMMQPMKAILQVKNNLKSDLRRDPADAELADAVNMNVVQLRKRMEVGNAARTKLIKHNLRLVLFVMNKYFQDFANGPKFQDLCQAGVKGLITAIDRFEPKRRFRLSTYGLYWIRHSIIRSMTLASFTKVPFGLESVRVEIQKAKLELMFELKRMPTEEEIVEKVGISPERYHVVMKASKPTLSLHSRHATTQEEFISGIADVDGVEGDKRRQSALLRLALDDVLDSLKPKESLVIRQRYGLDGKGDRTLGEIAGNLNISREMVRKHEVKALMKLKHPTRVEYLRQYIF